MIYSYDDAAACFKALGHPARLQILDALRHGEVCVCHIEAMLGQRQAYISQQLMLLREAGLVESRKEGMRVFYRLTCDLVNDLLDAAFGPLAETALAPLGGCTCPICVGPDASRDPAEV